MFALGVGARPAAALDGTQAVGVAKALIAAQQLSPAQKSIPFPQHLYVRQVQASPAAVTYGTSHTITSPLSLPALYSASPGYTSFALNPLYRYRKAGGATQKGTSYPNYNLIQFTSVNYAGAGGQTANMYGVAVNTDGASTGVEFAIRDGGAPFTVKIDGQYVSLTGWTTGVTGAIEYVFVPLTDGLMHEVELLTGGVNNFAGMYVPATASVEPAAPRGPTVIWLGDSGCEPTIPDGTNVPWNGMTQQFADAMGWDDVRTACVGGTGWLNPSTGGKVDWLDRISTDVCPFKPDIVFLPWSINDSTYTPAQETTQGQAIINAVKASNCAPKAQLIMGSAWIGNGGGSLGVNYYNINSAVRALAASNGLPYLDILEQALPAGFTAQTTTLQQAITSTASGGLLYTVNGLQVGGVYAFADGQHFIAKDNNYVAAGQYSTHYDALKQIEASGASVTQVGWPTVYGNGSITHTTGYGNGDLAISHDQTHPSAFGHQLFGLAYAHALLNTIRPANQ